MTPAQLKKFIPSTLVDFINKINFPNYSVHISIKYIIFFLWSLLALFFLYSHELWRDEVDFWLMVRDLPFLEWREYLRYSGHPGLFFLILYPVTKIGLSIVSMQVINFVLTYIGMMLLFFRSKLPDLILIPLLFGTFFIYRYPAFARNYSIGLLLLFLFISLHSSNSLWKRIMGYIALCLVVHTHLLFSLSGIAWGFFLLFEIKNANHSSMRKEKIIAALLLILSGIFLVYQVYPPESPSWYGRGLFKDNPLAWKISLPYTFFPGFGNGAILYKLSWLFILVWGVIFYTNKPIFITYTIGVSLYLIFFRFIYVAHANHLSVFFVFYISCLWVFIKTYKEYSKLFNFGLFFLFISAISQIIFAIEIDSKDLYKEFSGGKTAVEELNRCGRKDGDKIGVNSPFETKSILAYLPKDEKLFFSGINQYGSHMIWGDDAKRAYSFSESEVLLFILSKHPEIKFLVWTSPILDNLNDRIILCGRNHPEDILDPIEQFYIYKIN